MVKYCDHILLKLQSLNPPKTKTKSLEQNWLTSHFSSEGVATLPLNTLPQK